MSLISTTLCGPNALSGIRRALSSVLNHVDRCLCIDTSTEPRESLRVALTDIAGAKLILRHWPWRNDYGVARNAALDFARDAGASWSITLDDDEWWTGADEIRETLSRSIDDKVFYAFHNDGHYLQPRAIRLPSTKRWEGRTHESLALGGPRFKRARFCDDPKTKEQEKAKAIRDEVLLLQMAAEQPNDGRWFYYLGETAIILERWQEAVDYFLACAKLSNWGEEGAWACFRAAEVLSAMLERHADAVEICAAGLARHSGMAELCYQAALACARMDAFPQAIHWARLAKVHGENGADGGAALANRLLSRRSHMLREGPAELLSVIFRGVGNERRALEEEAELARWKGRAAGGEAQGPGPVSDAQADRLPREAT